jgi:hypothetical protein
MRSRLSSCSFALAALAALTIALPAPAFAADRARTTYGAYHFSPAVDTAAPPTVDVAIPRRQPITCPQPGAPTAIYPYFNTTDKLWHCIDTSPAFLNGSSVTATATEINRLHSVTPGTVAVSKFVAVDASGKVDTWDPTVLKKNGTTISATAAELNVLAGVVAGTVSASKGVVVDANGATLTVKTAALSLGTSGAETAVTATGTEINRLASVTAGTAAVSKAVVLDANKAIDESRVTTTRSLGGTGVPAAAVVLTEITKTVTAIADATATDVLTITVPNAAHVAQMSVCVTGVLGAGGAIGAGEAAATNCYVITLVRTAGVNAVATASSASGAAAAAVAGAATVTATAALSSVSGAVGASNSFTVKITITKSGGSSANHVAFVYARILNGNATGISIS